MTIGMNIKKYRKRMGLTQDELGKKLGIKQQTIAMYENDKTNIKPVTLKKIANALNVSLTDLMPELLLTDSEKKAIINAASNAGPERLSEINRQRIENLNKRKREQLLSNYDKVNEDGKEKIFEYSKDIASNPNYNKDWYPSQPRHKAHIAVYRGANPILI